jgi:hypothetical protein
MAYPPFSESSLSKKAVPEDLASEVKNRLASEIEANLYVFLYRWGVISSGSP